jgi:hypothetical protein
LFVVGFVQLSGKLQRHHSPGSVEDTIRRAVRSFHNHA